jgi:hypothetical protein
LQPSKEKNFPQFAPKGEVSNLIHIVVELPEAKARYNMVAVDKIAGPFSV